MSDGIQSHLSLTNLSFTLLASFMAILVSLTICVSAFASSFYTVNVQADGKTKQVNTIQRDYHKILEKANVPVHSGDKIQLDQFHPGTDADLGNTIKVARPKTVTIKDDGETVGTIQAAGEVKDALKTAKVHVRDTDELNYPTNKDLQNGLEIQVTRSFPVFLKADGETYSIDTTGKTVADVIAEFDIDIGDHDIVTPSLQSKVSPGTSIKIGRVSYKTTTKEEIAKYDTKIKQDSSLKAGQSKTEQKGKNGKKLVTYRQKFIDGKFDSQEKIDEKITKKPITEIIRQGTVPTNGIQSSFQKSVTLDSSGKPVNAIATFTGKASAYCAGTITASGMRARKGVVAVNPRQIPYGSQLYIASPDGSYVYGYAVAGDTGGFVHNGSGRMVDLRMNSNAECRQFGVRTMVIYVLKWG